MKKIKILPLFALSFFLAPAATLTMSPATAAVAAALSTVSVDTVATADSTLASGISAISMQVVAADSTLTAVADSAAALVAAADSALTAVADSAAALVATADSTLTAVADSTAALVAAADSTMLNKPLHFVKDTVFRVRHFALKERTPENRDLLISYYKNILSVSNTGEAYSNAYPSWKEAFTASENRELDLYVDGVGIILGTINNDTAKHDYSRISTLNDELMELYEIAINNVDKLNEQIDFTRVKDSITVAKLRAQQVKYYRSNVVLDSIFNANDTIYNNTYSKESENYWEEIVLKDSLNMQRMYPWLKEIAMSGDVDVDLTHMVRFINMSYLKIKYDKVYGSSYAKMNWELDRDLAVKHASNILAANTDAKKAEVYPAYLRQVEDRAVEGDGAFIAAGDYERLEIYWTDRWNREGDDVIPELLSSALAKNDSSAVYLAALRNRYEVEPTYAAAKDIAHRATVLKDYGTAKGYYERFFEYPDFLDESSFVQARFYVNYVRMLQIAKTGGNNLRYNYLQKAIMACPEYPEPYFYIAELVRTLNLGKSKKLTIAKKYMVAYDRYLEVKEKLKELAALGENTDVKTTLTEEIVNGMLAHCRDNFLTPSDLFMEGLKKGEKFTIGLGFATFSSTYKVVETLD